MSDDEKTSEGDAPEGKDDEITEADRETLRGLIRDEVKAMLPKLGDTGTPSPEAGGAGDAAGDLEGANPADLSLRQMTQRSMILAAKALDKIPGGAVKTAEPKTPAVEKAPVPRGLKMLGFHDID